MLGLVRDLRTPPKHVLAANRVRDGHPDIGMFGAKLAGAVAFLDGVADGTQPDAHDRRAALQSLAESTRKAALQIAG